MGAALLEQVDGLADLIGSQVPKMEADRRLTDEVVAAIRRDGRQPRAGCRPRWVATSATW